MMTDRLSSDDDLIMMTAQEVTACIKCSVRTLANWIERGDFPRPMKGRGKGERRRWTRRQVLDWAARRTA